MSRAWVAFWLMVVAACGAASKRVWTGRPSTCASVGACTKECDASHANACTRLGLRYAGGDGVPTDEARALALYQKACDAGDGEGCQVAGATLLYTGDPAAKGYFNRAAYLYRRACDAGDGASCGELGVIVEAGSHGEPKNAEHAARLYRKGCEAGHATSCFYLGMAYDDGKGVPRSAAETARWYEKACDLGDPDSCGLAANLWEDGTAGCDFDKVKDLRLRGVDGYVKKCDEGDEFACWSAASELDLGMGIPTDHGRATELLEKGCGMSGRYSCNALAERFEGGDEIPRDGDYALELHRKACDLGEDDSCLGVWRLLTAAGKADEAEGFGKRALEMRENQCARAQGAASCLQLAHMYEKGEGVTMNPARVEEYTRMTAERRKGRCLNEATGWECGQAAKMYSDGAPGVPPNAATAGDLWRRACDGMPYYCNEAGERAEKGKGIPVDPETAKDFFTRGCEFDNASACTSLARLLGNDKRAAAIRAKAEKLSVSCEAPDDYSDEDYRDDGDEADYGDFPGDDIDGDGQPCGANPCGDGE